jgi:hypothetical protein
MKKIYIAGPMTGLPELNYPAFHAAAATLRAQGHHVENPAENPVPCCGTWHGYMRLALKQLADCDAIQLLPGWERSRGAMIEFNLAKSLSLEILGAVQHGQPAAGLRCHDANACAMGQQPCPTPAACGCAPAMAAPEAVAVPDFDAWWSKAGDGRSKMLAKRAWEAALRSEAPAADALDAALIGFIEKAGRAQFERVRVGSVTGEIRWDIEFGYDDAEVRAPTLQEAIALAAQAAAKEGGAA